jgi:hypothetical protein
MAMNSLSEKLNSGIPHTKAVVKGNWGVVTEGSGMTLINLLSFK